MTQPRTKSGRFAPTKRAAKKAVAKPSNNRQTTVKEVKPTTCKGWLETLFEPERSWALEAAEKWPRNHRHHDAGKSQADAIHWGINWIETPQGLDYWIAMRNWVLGNGPKPTWTPPAEAKPDTDRIAALEARILALEKAAAPVPVAEPQGLEEGDYIEATPEVVARLKELGLATYSSTTLDKAGEFAIAYRHGQLYSVVSDIGVLRANRHDFLARAEVTACKLGTWPVDPAVQAAKELAEKEATLVFGVPVMTPIGKGLYHFRDGDDDRPHWISFPDGNADCFHTSDLTLIEE